MESAKSVLEQPQSNSRSRLLPMWPLAVGMLICSLVFGYFTYGIAYREFNFAWWTRNEHLSNWLPGITACLKALYPAVWVLPALTGIFLILVIARRITREAWFWMWVTFIATLHFIWFFFWLLGLYVVNQTFVCL